MGAKLLLAYLPAARMTKKRTTRLHRLVDTLPDRALPSEELASGTEGSELRPFLHDQVDRLPHRPADCRDILELQLPHMPYPLLFTGGHSWGDDPSPSFDLFCALGAVPAIYRQFRMSAIADSRGSRSAT